MTNELAVDSAEERPVEANGWHRPAEGGTAEANGWHRPAEGGTAEANGWHRPAEGRPVGANGWPGRTGSVSDYVGSAPDREAGGRRVPDLAAAQRAAAEFLTALGISLDDDGLRDTPARMARAYAELFALRPFRLTTFPNDEGYNELVIARGIPFRAVCEHHLLPFCGVAHVGYLPGERILGLSKLARLVEHFAARPQTQERLTKQVAQCLSDRVGARGVGVVLEAEHSCMTVRGVRAIGATTVTSTLLGCLSEDQAARTEFLALAGVHA